MQGVLWACKGCCKCARGCNKCAQGCMCVCTAGVHGAVGVCAVLWVCRCPCSGMAHARGLHLGTPQAQQGRVTRTGHPKGFGHGGAQRSPEISGFGKSQELRGQ